MGTAGIYDGAKLRLVFGVCNTGSGYLLQVHHKDELPCGQSKEVNKIHRVCRTHTVAQRKLRHLRREFLIGL